MKRVVHKNKFGLKSGAAFVLSNWRGNKNWDYRVLLHGLGKSIVSLLQTPVCALQLYSCRCELCNPRLISSPIIFISLQFMFFIVINMRNTEKCFFNAMLCASSCRINTRWHYCIFLYLVRNLPTGLEYKL